MKQFAILGILLFTLLTPLTLLSQGNNMSNPIIMGTYGNGTHEYHDQRHNYNYGNDFGDASPDIFYSFTVQGMARISIQTCASQFDTYLHLLNNAGDAIAINNNGGPLCNGVQASINYTLQPGTYYIVAEGSGSATGRIYLSVYLSVEAFATDPRNFIRTWHAAAPETSPATLSDKGLKEVKEAATYYDGIGRTEQLVVKKGSLTSSANKDIVTPFEYDQYGREVKKHLPYVASTNDGVYKTDALTQQESFNQNWYSSQSESHFYHQTAYEASPLNRVVKSLAPGVNWAGANRGVSSDYLLNTAADEVRVWTVTEVANDFGIYASPAAYGAERLFKNVITDEQNKKVIEYKDKDGQVILKKTQLSDNPSAGHAGWLCTYYIYDDLKRLRAVLQPKAVEQLPMNGWQLSADILNELAFRYEYDARGRMIMKKVPGAAPSYMVYDSRDRLVMSQDGILRNEGKWLVTQYDQLNRPIATGLWLNGSSLASHLAGALNSISYPDVSTGWELLTETHY
ncbi:DUF6443 domain-containing protein, partial [Longitalea luteola]|uniref:DUF6443 domain-containing protein n=1 Tax=Longitalea luteola TaxID=2812563 RepID=UPI001A957DFE